MKLRIFAVLLCLLCSVSSGAQVFAPNVTQTIGTGSNLSYFVLNFEDGQNFAHNPASDFVFGYRWNYVAGNVAPTGDDMIHALATAGTGVGLQVSETVFSFGTLVNSFSYGSHSQTGNYNLNQSYWAYWLSTDAHLGQNASDWTSAQVGVSSRQLTNGSYDGWTFSAFGVTPIPITPAAVPEPGSLAMFVGLGISGVGFLSRRRKQARKAA